MSKTTAVNETLRRKFLDELHNLIQRIYFIRDSYIDSSLLGIIESLNSRLDYHSENEYIPSHEIERILNLIDVFQSILTDEAFSNVEEDMIELVKEFWNAEVDYDTLKAAGLDSNFNVEPYLIAFSDSVDDLLNAYGLSNEKNELEKRILFPPHLKQAGISALSYFNRILETKYKGDDIQVSIIQSPNSNTVTLTISTPDGKHLERIEKDLTTFSLVITGQEQIEELNIDPIEQVRLAAKIDNLNTELKTEQRINNLLIGTIDDLKKQLSDAMEGRKNLEETLCSVLTNRSPETSKSLKIIDSLVTAALGGELDQESIKDELEKVKEKDPDTYQDIIDVIKGASGSGMGNVLGEILLGNI